MFIPTFKKLIRANFLAFSFSLKLASGMAEMASIPTIKLNQIMYSAWSGYLSRIAISLENRLAIKMKTEDENLFGIEKLNVKRSSIPAVTHVDYSARIQTVHKDTNQKYYNLINEFKKITNCPILVNTSFNISKDPMVFDLFDVYTNMRRMNIEYVVMNNGIFKVKEI